MELSTVTGTLTFYHCVSAGETTVLNLQRRGTCTGRGSHQGGCIFEGGTKSHKYRIPSQKSYYWLDIFKGNSPGNAQMWSFNWKADRVNVYCNGISVAIVLDGSCDVTLDNYQTVTLNNFDGGYYYFGWQFHLGLFLFSSVIPMNGANVVSIKLHRNPISNLQSITK